MTYGSYTNWGSSKKSLVQRMYLSNTQKHTHMGRQYTGSTNSTIIRAKSAVSCS